MNLNNFISKKKKKEDKKIIFKNIEKLNDKEDETFFNLTKSIICDNELTSQSFFDSAMEKKAEGIMFKNLKSNYKSGLRCGNIVKYKNLLDDLDLVILAAEMGNGKRAGFYSTFYVGIKKGDKILEIGKVSSGIKDLEGSSISIFNLSKILKPLVKKIIKEKIFFEHKIIVQVRYQEIQISEKYESGFALRFPRIICLRDDKLLDEISSLDNLT